MPFNIFAINPGSTSTKVGIFKGSACGFERVLRHDPDELKAFPTAVSQFEYRLGFLQTIIDEEGCRLENIDAFVGRGGVMKPLKGGTYYVGRRMLEDLASGIYGDHASNLGAMIAAKLAAMYGKPAFTVNPVVVDELMDEARFTGLPGIVRKSVFHALNQKAAAIRAAAEAGIDYDKGRFIVAHLGGGISVGAHINGCVTDVNNALEEGPFSPERAGSLPAKQLVDLCFSGRYSREEIYKLLAGKGGLFAHTGTTDCRALLKEAEGDKNVLKILDAMIYKIAREICANAAAMYGETDRIVITGGLAYSSYIVEGIRRRVSFLAPVVVYPGEDELAALAEGAIRVLEGKEQVLDYE